MLGPVTGATAFGLGASAVRSASAAVLGFLLSLGGFLLDDSLDLGARWEPERSGAVPRRMLAASLLSIAAAAVVSLLLEPWALLPAAMVVLVVVLPSVGVASGPLARAVSLGLLQALYAVIGGLVARSRGPGLPLLALFLLAAMTGGRVLGDLRDLETDQAAGLITIPTRYGLRRARVFLLACELAAYAVGLAAGVAGKLGWGYLGCMAAIAAVGTAINLWLLARPTPRRADIANRWSLGVLGGLYTAGMILAGLGVGRPGVWPPALSP